MSDQIQNFIRVSDFDMSADDLQLLFSPFGKITNITLLVDSKTQTNQHEAMISFENNESAMSAWNHLNGAQINGKTIKISQQKDPKRQVIVIGGGLAGLSAAISASSQNAQVLILEKEPKFGGNSAKASSGMNAVGTDPQKQIDKNDSFDDFARDTLSSGSGLSDPSLVEHLTKSSLDAWKFLTDLGVDLSVVSRCGGHSHARTHRNSEEKNPANVGFAIISALQQKVKDRPSIKILQKARAKKLITNAQGNVTSVCADLIWKNGKTIEMCLPADGVVIATGGFAASGSEHMKKHRPDLANFPSTNGQHANGDGINLCSDVGAALIQMDKVQVHPTGLIDPSDPSAPVKFLAPEALRAHGGILLTRDGKRFTNEVGRRDEIVAAIRLHCGTPEGPNPAHSYLLLSKEAAKKYGEKKIGFYQSKGLVTLLENASRDFAKITGAAEEIIRKTLLHVNACTSGQEQDPFGRSHFGPEFDPSGPAYLLQITPSLHYTMGGVAFNVMGQVLRSGDMQPIPGLFAAGEVTGGLHGQNRLAGNSLLECVVYGRTAGANAATWKEKDCVWIKSQS